MKLRALVVLAALIFGACNEQEAPQPPGSFDRPTRVAFVCFDMQKPETPTPTALTNCDANASSGVGTSTFWLHALVIQSSRGEVAAVDLTHGKTLDSRADIPGFTFLPVGELPSAIAVPVQAEHSKFTYVANAGTRDITVLRTRAFRQLSAEEQATAQTVQLPGGSRDAPQDMVLSPDEDALFVSIPNTRRLLRLPIKRCNGCADEGTIDIDAVTEFPLARSLELAVPSPGGDVEHPAYANACFYDRPIPNSTIAVDVPALDGAPAPQPSGLSLDDFCETDKPCRRRLLVADAALPLIHVIDLEELSASGADAAVQPPILTGAPTLSVVVTPRVPSDTSAEATETQYVYAIDARDGSVLVTENGKLLAVGTEDARSDRVTLGVGSSVPHVLALSVVTPAFDVHGPAAQYTQESPELEPPMASDGNFCTDNLLAEHDPKRLRGVFLAVGATDGTVRLIDVHDMDVANCRHCEQGYKEGCVCDPNASRPSNMCEACAVSWDPYPLVRHRTRLIQKPDPDVPEPRLAPVSSPAFIAGSLLMQVRTTGTTSDPAIPGLECVACGEGQAAAFPVGSSAETPPSTPDGGMGDEEELTDPCKEGAARVCALADPWGALEDWRAFYKGALPGTQGGQGQFTTAEDGTPEFRGETSFCALGVLGADALPGRAGDQLTIIGELPPDEIIRKTEPHVDDEGDALATCKELVQRRDRSEDKIPIAFEIRAAYADRLVIASQLTSRPTMVAAGFDNDIDLVKKCFGNMLLTYEVRSGSGYVLLGVNTTGFEHRVKAAEGTGHCEQDPNLPPKRDGRAYEGEPFDNGRVTFQIAAGGAPQLDTMLALRLGGTTAKAELNMSVIVEDQVIASLPVDLGYSSGNLQLYAVDVSYRGLVPISVFQFSPSFVSTSFR